MPDWSRVVNTTIHEYIKGAEPAILRNRKLLALMQSRGRITFNHSGDLMDWKVKYKRAPMQGYADSDTLTFSRRDRWKTAQLEYRGYAATDSMTKLEKLKNKDAEAIVKVYEQVAPSLLEDIDDQFGDELYIDGNASGNSKRIHGISSFMGGTTGASNGYVVTNNDTYAGLSTVLGNYGGSWNTSGGNTTWPTGAGDAHYDFWSPLIVDTTDSAWTASGDNWATGAVEQLSYGIIKGKKNKSKSGMLDLILLNDESYRLFLELYRTKEQLNVNRGSESPMYKLGFMDTVNLDGVDITFEYGVPSVDPNNSTKTLRGYGWCMDQLELCSLQSQMFVPEGPDFDISTQSWRFSIDFFGNLKFKSVRNFAKWVDIT